MNIVSQLFSDAIKSVASTNTKISELAYKVRTGKEKLTVVEIAAHGGPGISRKQKFIAKQALRRLADED